MLAQVRQCLDRSEESTAAAVAKEGRVWEEKMDQLRQEHGKALDRQLKLVDRLLSDKGELTKRCDALATELEALRLQQDGKLKQFEQALNDALQKQRTSLLQAEKDRRLQWEQVKVREIKEQTLRGLEPTVDKLLAEQGAKERQWEEKCKQMVEQVRRDLLEQGQREVREAVAQATRLSDEGLVREREHHRQALRAEYDSYSRQLSEDRQRQQKDLDECRKHYERALLDQDRRWEEKMRGVVEQERAEACKR
jgi:5-azacytidine-induced protein 1